jgi:DNA-binding HxlR family transcriptional regulator
MGRSNAALSPPCRSRWSIQSRRGATLANAVDPLRDWAEGHLKEVLNARRRYDAQRKPIAA